MLFSLLFLLCIFLMFRGLLVKDDPNEFWIGMVGCLFTIALQGATLELLGIQPSEFDQLYVQSFDLRR